MKKFWDRESLKSFFRNGQLPTEVHFKYLIDSTINKLDDGISKSREHGLQLSPAANAESIISISKNPTDPNPSWQMSIKNEENSMGLSFDSVANDNEKKSRLFLADNGNIGIGNTNPRTQLEVSGTLGTGSRIGTLKTGQVDGDGQWHCVIGGLKGVEAFEVVARIDGPPSRGKYAITHAVALGTYGGSGSRIKQVRAYYGWFMNRIEFRWHGNVKEYCLQVRTRSNYGLTTENEPLKIRFHITRLWDDLAMKQYL